MIRWMSIAGPGMDTDDPQDAREGISRWFLDGLDATQQVEGILRNALLDLRHTIASPRIDPGLRGDLLHLLGCLENAMGRVTELQSSATDALRALAAGVSAGTPPIPQRAPGQSPLAPRGRASTRR